MTEQVVHLVVAVNSQIVHESKIMYCSFQTYDSSGGGGDANDSRRRRDEVGGGTGGEGKQEISGNLSDDNRAITSGHGRYSCLW